MGQGPLCSALLHIKESAAALRTPEAWALQEAWWAVARKACSERRHRLGTCSAPDLGLRPTPPQYGGHSSPVWGTLPRLRS